HQFPEPELLNKVTWSNYVLPKMSGLFGLRHFGMNRYIESGDSVVLKPEVWHKIVEYYITQSPTELGKANSQLVIKKGLDQFIVYKPPFGVRNPATTMVSAGSLQKGFYFGDGLSQQVYLISREGTVVDSFAVQKGVADIRVSDTAMLALTMGVLQPSDSKDGKLLSINTLTKEEVVLMDSLQRPVHATYADLNMDNLEDIVVCEFGNNSGQLAWYENKGQNKYTVHILRPLPGAIKTEVYDFNKDGLPDLVAMMAQGDEGIFIYYNQGNNTFKEQRILQLPPSYGSNYFELVDFNNDGYPDIIATNGDNGDYPPVLKAYHGIRIYINDGNNNFKEKIFLPINGAGKACAKDFDGDGDLDIASISFFPDYKSNPEEGFVYWKNTGKLSFEPSSFTDVTAGRWMTMDAGDIDQDGDIDLVLGNAAFTIGAVPDSLIKKWNEYSPSVLVLKNTLY
ncbi:MAG: FG-GAP repeat domain-containing protein, partial [Chitinophagaceae bacterium]